MPEFEFTVTTDQCVDCFAKAYLKISTYKNKSKTGLASKLPIKHRSVMYNKEFISVKAKGELVTISSKCFVVFIPRIEYPLFSDDKYNFDKYNLEQDNRRLTKYLTDHPEHKVRSATNWEVKFLRVLEGKPGIVCTVTFKDESRWSDYGLGEFLKSFKEFNSNELWNKLQNHLNGVDIK